MDHQIMITNKNNDNNILKRMNMNSHTILSKNKPQQQVRIIHVFAPEIIKTDPANFRELVQRLTGKPSSTTRQKMNRNMSYKKKSFVRNDVERVVKCEEEGEIWRSCSSSGGSGCNDQSGGGFLEGFDDDEDGFMQELGYFQPSLDLLPQNHSPLLMHHHHHHHHTDHDGDR